MKSKKLIFLEKILRAMAVAVLKRRKPIIVGITGSVGKTSAKEAIALVLATRLKVRKNEKNYNNEIGIPLTVIGASSGGRNLLRWIVVFLKWLWAMSFSMKYPKVLVLEMGIDRPGDMKYLTSFIKPSMAVVTNISSSHIEFFGTIGKIAKEKGVLVESVPENGFVFLNADDENVLKMQERTKANIVTYGFSESSEFRADRPVYNYDENDRPSGISFKLEFSGKSIPVRLPKILAFHQLYFALMSIAIGDTFKINPIDAMESLKELSPPQGRMTLIEGINGSMIIDDTYNSSPISCIAALGVLESLGSKRRIAILGDMLELGEQSKQGHISVIKKINNANIDILIAVGRRMVEAAKELVDEGFPAERVICLKDPFSASTQAKKLIREGDMILVKGSQGMRMEKVVEAIMKNPKDAKKILCRQSIAWKRRKYITPSYILA